MSSLSSHLYRLGAGRERRFERARAALEARMFPDVAGDGPTRIAGRYVPDRMLGSGAFGTVYLAHDVELDRFVALKVLHRDLLDDPSQDLIATEARALARVSHPNVVAVFDVGVWEGKTYLAMEYVPGGNLRSFLSQKHAGALQLPLVMQAGRGLAAAHDAGIVHRDLKPENVLVGRDGRVRVGDFGLARPLVDASLEDGASSDESARVGGTPFYMAPELLDGSAADRASDQYAFFVCAYEAAYGARPFEARSIEHLRMKVLGGPSRPRHVGDVPPRVFDVIVRGLDPDPQRRFPNMHAAVDALDAALVARRRVWPWLGLLAVPFVGGAVIVAASVSAPSTERCASDTSSVWNQERSTELWRATIASGRPAAVGGWLRVEDRIDRWVAASNDAHASACRDHDAAALECLALRRQQLDVVLRVVQEHATDPCATELLRALDNPARCGASEGDIASFAAIVARGADLAEQTCGDARDEAQLRELEAFAEEAAPFPAAASLAWHMVGIGRDRLRRGGSAVAAFERAYEVADVDDIANHVAASRSLAVMHAAIDAAEAQRWASEAVSLAERSNALDDRCMAAAATARVAVESSDWARAEKTAHAGLAVCGVDSFEASDFYAYLGTVTTHQQRHAEGKRWIEMRRDLDARNWGRDHPQYALAEAGMGVVRPGVDVAQARRSLVDALAVLERTYGPEHPDTLWVRSRIGALELHEGNLDRAREVLESTWAMLERIPAGEDPLRRLWHLNDLAQLHRARGDVERELAWDQLAVDHALEWLGEHPLLGGALSNMATALRRSGRLEEALARFEQAIEVSERQLGPTSPTLAFPIAGRAETLSDLGRDEEALEQYERALAIVEAGSDLNAIAIVGMHVALRLPESEHARAVELAERSLPILRAQGERHAKGITRLEQLISSAR
jgi:tRNA A-37 threonylcarbamoyl transferase component Bud32/tetratricopeptide (TPR) repeat protein